MSETESTIKSYTPTTFKQLKCLIKSDLYRYYGNVRLLTFFKAFIIPGFCYTFYLRLCQFLSTKKRYIVFRIICQILLHHFQFRFGISIPYRTNIGPGLYIGHFSGIIVNGRATIGSNCNLSPNTSIGQANRGPRTGVPEIGNNVYIGPNVCIVGKVKIGDDIAIGAGSVVVKDIPSHCTVVGVPAKVVSDVGSEGYVNRVYESSCF